MLYPRIIPCLLVRNKGLVKTFKFDSSKYIGDPINAVRIFNEKKVDELILLDIDATTEKREPDYKLVKNLAVECRMPFCYGGGVKSVEAAHKILELGVEKIALSSAAIENPNIIRRLSENIGSQSVVVVLDVKKHRKKNEYYVMKCNGTVNTGNSPSILSKMFEEYGAGEIVINSIDNDGTMQGYDLSLMDNIRQVTSIPITALGGAGSFDDIGMLIEKFGIIGAAAGSLFVFKGHYRAVLINYPETKEKQKLFSKYLREINGA